MLLKDNKTGLFSIRNRILIFTLFVTLIPSLGLGWAFYLQTEELLQEKVEQELRSGVGQAKRETELWLKEVNTNIRVFSNSFVVTENLEQFLNARQLGGMDSQQQSIKAIALISDYLSLIQSQFHEYKRLLVLDRAGKIITQSPRIESPLQLPDDWQEQVEQNKMVIGEVDGNNAPSDPTLLIAIPILSNQQTVIGLLATELRIKGLESILESFTLSESAHLFLAKNDGSIIISTEDSSARAVTTRIERTNIDRLFDNPLQLATFDNSHGIKVIGILAPLPHLSWGVVMEKAYDQVFAEVIALKNLTLIAVTVLLSIFGIAALLVSQSILLPLKRLITAARQVAEGDLQVRLPIRHRDELGFAMSVFNDMVLRLRENHDELEKLSTTDPLTGLANRKQLMETFALHLERYQRNQTPFSILMADLDHFKQVNDHHGHLAGDAVLKQVGNIFSSTLRAIDTAGRYGGEEFLIILDGSREHEAQQTAERLRKAVEESEIDFEGKTLKVSISIGVATVSNIVATEAGLISDADKALYEAKKGGRNRVVLSTPKVVALAPHPDKESREK